MLVLSIKTSLDKHRFMSFILANYGSESMIPLYCTNKRCPQWWLDDLINHMVMREAWYDIRWRNLRLEDWLIILRAGFAQKYEWKEAK